jgi:hypothetical protein
MTARPRAGCRFFQRLPHRLGADRLYQTQDDNLVRQQLQRPVAPPTGRVGACQLHEFLLDVPFDLDLVRPRWLRSVVDRRIDPFRDESLPDAGNRVHADIQGGDDLIIAMPPSPCGIGQQEDPCMGQPSTRRLPGGNQLFQGSAFVRFQADTELLHHDAPSPGGHPSKNIPRDHEFVLPVNRRWTRASPPFMESPGLLALLRDSRNLPPNRSLTAH